MVALSVRILVAAVLLAGVAGKLRSPQASRLALANLGAPPNGATWVAWSAALVVELGCLVAVAVAPSGWLVGPALVFTAFAALLAVALRRGAAGRACGCFGRRGTVSRRAVARNLALATALLAVAAWPADGVDGVTVERVALVVMAGAIAGLTIALLALAREVGVLRIAVGSTGVALELDHEGPRVGVRLDIGGWCEPTHDGLAVAVFTSAGCVMCQGLGPTLDYLGQDPWLVLRTFDEERDRDQWTAFAVPGSPYAVVLQADGTVRAKGTFNGLPQLEGLVASAARRRAEAGVGA
ncbi:MAG: hypothetical protein JWN65_3700 [Solirubrobacterales bacterium]|nr:hypothetical protein [Solirubrobacterales bacterium]